MGPRAKWPAAKGRRGLRPPTGAHDIARQSHNTKVGSANKQRGSTTGTALRLEQHVCQHAVIDRRHGAGPQRPRQPRRQLVLALGGWGGGSGTLASARAHARSASGLCFTPTNPTLCRSGRERQGGGARCRALLLPNRPLPFPRTHVWRLRLAHHLVVVGLAGAVAARQREVLPRLALDLFGGAGGQRENVGEVGEGRGVRRGGAGSLGGVAGPAELGPSRWGRAGRLWGRAAAGFEQGVGRGRPADGRVTRLRDAPAPRCTGRGVAASRASPRGRAGCKQPRRAPARARGVERRDALLCLPAVAPETPAGRWPLPGSSAPPRGPRAAAPSASCGRAGGPTWGGVRRGAGRRRSPPRPAAA
jgi:hypothetical protein